MITLHLCKWYQSCLVLLMLGISEGSKDSLKKGCVLLASPSSSCLTQISLAWRRSSWKLVSSHNARRLGSSSFSTCCPSTQTLTWKTSEANRKQQSSQMGWKLFFQMYVEADVSPQPLVRRRGFCRYDGTARLLRCISDTQHLHQALKPPEPNPAPRWTAAPWLCRQRCSKKKKNRVHILYVWIRGKPNHPTHQLTNLQFLVMTSQHQSRGFLQMPSPASRKRGLHRWCHVLHSADDLKEKKLLKPTSHPPNLFTVYFHFIFNNFEKRFLCYFTIISSLLRRQLNVTEKTSHQVLLLLINWQYSVQPLGGCVSQCKAVEFKNKWK